MKNNILFAFRLKISQGSMFGNISTLNKFNLSSNDGENCHDFWFPCANKMITQRKWPQLALWQSIPESKFAE